MNIPQQFSGGTLIHAWEYKDQAGDTLGHVGRYEPDPPDGSKQVIPHFKKNGAGWKSGGPAEPKPLYGLEKLADLDKLADPTDGFVCVVEGEKAAAGVHQLGWVAVSSLGGSSAADKADWSPLKGRNVVIFPDNDEAGKKYAADVAAELDGLGINAWVCELDALPAKGDIVDWIQARVPGWDGYSEDARISTLADELLELVGKAQPAKQSLAQEWPDPISLPDPMGEVLKFDFKLLPNALRDWAADITKRMGCPPDFVGAAIIVAIAAVIGRQCRIRPKKKDNWQVVPNLWGAIVGRPSTMKSPALSEALKPLERLVMDAREEHEKENLAAMGNGMLASIQMDQVKVDMKAEVRENPERPPSQKAEALAKQASELNETIEFKPPERRYITNDPTVEKAGELLQENTNGLLIFRDELVGWLRNLDREDRASDRSFYIESWSGDSPYVVDRIGRGTTVIPALCLSILGGIQPGPLAQYVAAASSGGRGADGLLQRFQVLVWPDSQGEWNNVDEWPDIGAKTRAFDAFKWLSDLTPTIIGAEVEDDKAFLRFSDAAQDVFDAWLSEFMNGTVLKEESEALESHFTKYQSLVPSLALIIHLVDQTPGPVSIDALYKALGWVKYLESHARRLYAFGIGGGTPEALALAKKIQDGKVGVKFAARDVVQKGWSRLANTDAVKRAIKVLEAHHWLSRQSVTTGGRPAEIYTVNPKVLQ